MYVFYKSISTYNAIEYSKLRLLIIMESIKSNFFHKILTHRHAAIL